MTDCTRMPIQNSTAWAVGARDKALCCVDLSRQLGTGRVFLKIREEIE